MQSPRWFTSVFLSFAAVGLGACSVTDPVTEPLVTELSGAACVGALAEACRQACANDLSCAEGLHCLTNAGECSADCSDEVDCANGQMCDLRGRCVAGEGDGAMPDGSVPGPGASGGNTNQCVDIQVAYEEQTPNVLLLVDWSGSMNNSFGDLRRWEAVEKALIDPQNGVVASLQDRVRFGILMYSSYGGFGDRKERGCPVLQGKEIAIALNNLPAIQGLYQEINGELARDTPTAEALHAATGRLADLDQAGPKLIVLATDGDPDSCEVPNPNGQEPPKRASEQQVRAAYEAGIETRVIAVGKGTVAQAHLQNMANLGAGFEPDGQEHGKAYEPNSPEDLVAAFSEIVAGARSCAVDLSYRVSESAVDQGEVTLDGSPLQLGTDWRLSSPTTVELLGAACERLKLDASSLSITFPCDADVTLI